MMPLAARSAPVGDRKVMDNAFEGLFKRAIDLDAHPNLKRRLVELGIDFEKGLKPMYPQAVWAQSLVAAAEELAPQEPLPKAVRALGERVVLGYFETLIGRPLKAMVRAIGVRRTLTRMTQSFAAATNYTATRLEELGERHHELWMNEVGLTQHSTAGILQTGLSIAGGKNVRVEIVKSDDEGVTYDVTWE
jgi:uncharacterized protein (TIGR02265 family)